MKVFEWSIVTVDKVIGCIGNLMVADDPFDLPFAYFGPDECKPTLFLVLVCVWSEKKGNSDGMLREGGWGLGLFLAAPSNPLKHLRGGAYYEARTFESKAGDARQSLEL